MTDYLKLTQWLSPAFPVGSFAYSNGLEAAITAGTVANATELSHWLDTVLRHGSGRTDAVLLCHSMRGTDLRDLSEALCGSAERWQETQEQGAAFLRTTNAIFEEDLPEMAFPVAVGTVARRLSLGEAEVAALYLHGFASNLVSVAVRFIPLGQTEGQKVLDGLHATIEEVANSAARSELDMIGTASFGADMAALHHEHMQPRVFRT